MLGSFDHTLGTAGMHTDADNIVCLPETVEILARVLTWYDGLPEAELRALQP